MTKRSTYFATFLAATLSVAIAAAAPARADEVDDLRAKGQIGEQADGYLGVRDGASPSAEDRTLMDSINIRRRAAYTERAAAQGVTVAEFGAATACRVLSTFVDPGEWYRDENGRWVQRQGNAPVTLPSYCPR